MSPVQTLPDMLLDRIARTPDVMAYQFPDGNGWKSMTWREAGDRVRALACGLRKLGVENEQRCAIVAGTRVEWVLSDLAILCAGAACTTIYPNSTAAECTYILNDSGTVLVFAENAEQVAKLVAERGKIPQVHRVIVIDGPGGHDGWVISLSELETMGRKHDVDNPELFDAVIGSIDKDHLATLIYTSGTTGRPKGVELVHDCWVFIGQAVGSIGLLSEDDHQYLWLPLSHSFGKMLEAVQLDIGFATTVDGRIPKLVENLAVVRPTFMAAAPRIFEKVYNKIVTGAQAAGGMKLKIFTWAVVVGRKVSQLRQQGREATGLLAVQYSLADRLVFSKLRALFGGRVRFFISGSAPLSREMAEFFHAAGILICEGYGLTESSAASFVNRPHNFRFGTVGQPVPGTEVMLAPEDGEILLRSRGIMRGYHNLPEVTAETLNDEGWLLTGDIGELDAEGFLKITDRKKDLIKTSGGKYVAPQKLEGKLKALCPYLSQVLVHGNRRNFCSVLVTLDEEAMPKWAADHGLAGMSVAELAGNPAVSSMVQHAVDELNSNLPRYETIKKFAILPSDWTVESGLLTASLKVKRKAVETRFSELLDGFYDGALAQV